MRRTVRTSKILWAFALSAIGAAIDPSGAMAQSGADGSFFSDSDPFSGRTVPIPMRDGNHLAGDIYVPRSEGPFPVVLIQTPYNKDLVRPWFRGEGRWGTDSLFTDTHYAFVVTDWRGRHASKDALEENDQGGHGEDGYDTIAWIAQQPWSNGKVGTWGPSALGAVQYRTAAEQPPNLVCAVPMVMALNLDYENYFHGGVMWTEFVNLLSRLGWDTREMLLLHQGKDLFWYTRSANTFVRPRDIRIPMLFVGGWYDIYTDSVIKAFTRIHRRGGPEAKKHSKLIMGPWVHRTDQELNGALRYPNAAGYSIGRANEFFDYWLRGEQNGWEEEPAITYYQMGDDQWRSSAVWPPENEEATSYFLRADGGLSTVAPEGQIDPSVYRYDPADPAPTVGGHVLDPALNGGPQDQREKVESRSDVLVFTTPALDRDTAVAGGVTAKLFVSSDRTDTDFSVILTDVYPDGRSMLVTEGIRRLRFRDTISSTKLGNPGKVYRIDVGLTNTAITFKKGHRIRLLVSSSNSPKYDVNLNNGGEMYGDDKSGAVVAENSVYHDEERPSALLLPLLKFEGE